MAGWMEMLTVEGVCVRCVGWFAAVSVRVRVIAFSQCLCVWVGGNLTSSGWGMIVL